MIERCFLFLVNDATFLVVFQFPSSPQHSMTFQLQLRLCWEVHQSSPSTPRNLFYLVLLLYVCSHFFKKKSSPMSFSQQLFLFISFQFCKLHFPCQHCFLRLLYCLSSFYFLFVSCESWALKHQLLLSSLKTKTCFSLPPLFFLFAIGIYVFWYWFKLYCFKCSCTPFPGSASLIPLIHISYYLSTLAVTFLLISLWIIQLTSCILKISVALLDGKTFLVEKRAMWSVI